VNALFSLSFYLLLLLFVLLSHHLNIVIKDYANEVTGLSFVIEGVSLTAHVFDAFSKPFD